MAVTMGIEPDSLQVVVQAGAAWVQEMTLDAASWEAGESLELRFSDGTTWPATLAGSSARWDQSASSVASLVAATPARAKLWYVTAAGEPFVWADGKVAVRS